MNYDRPRAFSTIASLTADTGDRWSGSVVRTYSDLSKQWPNTVVPYTGRTTIDTTFLIDEIAVKRASPADDLTGAVTVGAFAVTITDTGFTSCTEYYETAMFDTASTPKVLTRPIKWLTFFGATY